MSPIPANTCPEYSMLLLIRHVHIITCTEERNSLKNIKQFVVRLCPYTISLFLFMSLIFLGCQLLLKYVKCAKILHDLNQHMCSFSSALDQYFSTDLDQHLCPFTAHYPVQHVCNMLSKLELETSA